MQKTLYLALVTTSFTGIANANDGLYTSVKSGISSVEFKNSTYKALEETSNNNSKYETVYPSIYVAAGYDLSDISPVDARLELEYGYKYTTDFNPTLANQALDRINNEVTTQTLMLNGYYDIKNSTKFTPYVNTGVGFTHLKNKQTIKANEFSNSDSDNHFTLSAGVGVKYAVSKDVSLDLSYRYVDAGKFKFDNTLGPNKTETNVKLRSNEFLLGIQYKF